MSTRQVYAYILMDYSNTFAFLEVGRARSACGGQVAGKRSSRPVTRRTWTVDDGAGSDQRAELGGVCHSFGLSFGLQVNSLSSSFMCLLRFL